MCNLVFNLVTFFKQLHNSINTDCIFRAGNHKKGTQEDAFQ